MHYHKDNLPPVLFNQIKQLLPGNFLWGLLSNPMILRLVDFFFWPYGFFHLALISLPPHDHENARGKIDPHENANFNE